MTTDAAGTITVDVDGAVRVVTLNRPDHANAVNNAMHMSFARLWSELAEDRDARAVMLTGAGSEFFSAGGDLVQWLQNFVENPVTRRAGMRDARRIVRDMVDFPLPVVAAVNGPAIGGGLCLALACDVRVAAESAYFRAATLAMSAYGDSVEKVPDGLGFNFA